METTIQGLGSVLYVPRKGACSDIRFRVWGLGFRII